MMTAQPSSLFVSGLVESCQLARYEVSALEVSACLGAILVSHKLPRARFRGLRQEHIVVSMTLTFRNLQEGTAAGFLRQVGLASFFLSVGVEGSEREEGEDELHHVNV